MVKQQEQGAEMKTSIRKMTPKERIGMVICLLIAASLAAVAIYITKREYPNFAPSLGHLLGQ
jgi:hypothetical protein